MVIVQIDLDIPFLDTRHIDFDLIDVTALENIQSCPGECGTISDARRGAQHRSIGKRFEHIIEECVGVASKKQIHRVTPKRKGVMGMGRSLDRTTQKSGPQCSASNMPALEFEFNVHSSPSAVG